MTAEERARAVYRNATGPIEITRYACNSLEAEIAKAIHEAVLEEREAVARELEAETASWPDNPLVRSVLKAGARAIRERKL